MGFPCFWKLQVTNVKVSSVFYQVQGTTCGRTLQLIKLIALYSIYGKNLLNLILACDVASFNYFMNNIYSFITGLKIITLFDWLKSRT
jgi:hypothetical protein